MTESELDPRDRTTILVHYYRAMVGRADIWRTRMDTTTNWAIGATAAVISFSIGNAAVPHYVVFIAPLLTASFLMLEARRLTFYHLWQRRVLLLEEGLIRPALGAQGAAPPAPRIALGEALGPHLGRTAPVMALSKAVARRLRRVYIYLFAVQLLAWVFKLSNDLEPGDTTAALVSQASVGLLSGGIVFLAVALTFAAAFAMAMLYGGRDRERSENEVPQ